MIFSNAREPENGPSPFVGVKAIFDRSKSASQGGGQAMTGSPLELTLVLFLSATVFLSLWHFVAHIIG
jgi:hypothetical protein